jgi:hypothetical protein
MKEQFTNFKLPIEYLKDKHTLCKYLLSELELSETTKENEENKPVYNYLFQPNHLFATQMINKWGNYTTTNVEFLEETQNIIKNMHLFKDKDKIKENHVTEVLELWKDVKEDDFFHEKNQYMEFDFLKELNRSKEFLLTTSLLTFISPLLYIIIPIIFLLMPIILGFPLSSYFTILQLFACNYFFKTSVHFTLDKLMYVIISIVMSLFQMYHTFLSTYHYYNNLKKINKQISSLKTYLIITIDNIDYLSRITHYKNHYNKFFEDSYNYNNSLKELYLEIKDISPFYNSVYKLSDCGILLQKYYKIHENKEYEQAIRYSFGFNGYLSNLIGIYENVKNGYINFTNFVNKDNKMIDMYYPVLKDKKPIKNNIELDKNITISGPNASGKTSIIKTIAINVIFSQQIGAGFYKSCELLPYTNIHCYLNINDFSGRDSLFQQEARKCLNIIKSIESCNKSSRHLLIIDELYSGTNPVDSEKASHALLLFLSGKENVRFCLTTHLTKVCKKLRNNEKIRNHKMKVIKKEDGDFKYTYKIKEGISNVYGGYKVLSDMNYPVEILNSMKKI